jgi:hypothetical protein
MEKGIECCGECTGFPCADMAAFFEESDSHRQAYARMAAVHPEKSGTSAADSERKKLP